VSQGVGLLSNGLLGQAGRKESIHHQSLVTLSRKTSVVKALTEEGLMPPNRGVSPCRSISPGRTPDKVTQ
jgi:hypothetical protein